MDVRSGTAKPMNDVRLKSYKGYLVEHIELFIRGVPTQGIMYSGSLTGPRNVNDPVFQ